MLSTITRNMSIKVAISVISLCLSAQVLAKSNHKKWFPVTGTGIHYFSTAISHSTTPTDTGVIIRSTDTIDLFGDINGRVLYHVTSEVDSSQGTIVNTGHQVFSGTVMNSDPVLILDDDFEFNVNIFTGETIGKVFLTKRIAGQKIKCMLTVVGTGFDEQGNGLADYTGKCRFKGKRKKDDD